MGRSLKIRKTNNFTDIVNGNEIDSGFPNNGSTNNGFSRNAPGVVGGIDRYGSEIQCQARIIVKGLGTISASSSSTTITGVGTHFTTDAMINGNTIFYIEDATQPNGYALLGVLSSVTSDTALELATNSNLTLNSKAWYYSSEGYSAIIRQKGSRKFLVVFQDEVIQDESIAKGQAYMITSPGNTDWAALGADINAGYGDVFTAIKDGTGLTTDGVVQPVGICELVNEGDPGQLNTMSIGITGGTGLVSRIKNKFATDFSTPYANTNLGTTYSATFNNNGSTLPNPSAAYDLVYTTVEVENYC
jgi:hypothetical protein